MAFPEQIDRFTDKLNRKQGGSVYAVEEAVVILNGKFEGLLAHDNIVNSSVKVYTGSRFTGEELTSWTLSAPEETPWRRSIRIFAPVEKVYVTYDTPGDTVEAEDVNGLQTAVTAAQTELVRYEKANDTAVAGLRSRMTAAEAAKAEKTYVDGQLLTKADKTAVYTRAETDQRIQNIVAAAPAALDTLAEIASALNNDPDFAGTMTTQLAKKVDKVAGKGLSAEDYTTVEKAKLAGVAAGAGTAGSAADEVLGSRTLSDTAVPSSDTGFLTGLLGGLANRIKAITGKSSWRAAPATTLEAAKAHADDEVRHLTASERSAWNAKETPAGAQSKVDTHAGDTVAHVTAAERSGWNAKETPSGAQAKVDAHAGDEVKHITASERSLWNTVSGKVQAVSGKGLSTEDYTTAEKAKLSGIAAGANAYAHPGGDGNLHVPATGTTNGSKVLKAGTAAGSIAWGSVNASEVVEDASRRFVTDSDKSAWNAKETPAGAQARVDSHAGDTVKHVTAAERTAWNAKQASLGFTPENTSKKGAANGYAGLDAAGKLPASLIPADYVTQSQLGSAGYGDMSKAVYDANGNGKVDQAEAADSVPWSGVTGKPSTFTPTTHTHDDRYYTEAESDARFAKAANYSTNFTNGRFYCGTVGGSTDLGWKTLFRMTGTDRSGSGAATSTGAFYDAGTVMGAVYDRGGNYSQSAVSRYPFQFTLHAWSGTSRMDSVMLFLPSGIPDVLRVVKYGINDYELQIRSHGSYRHVSFELWEAGGSLAQYAYRNLAAESGTYTVIRNNASFNSMVDGPAFADVRNKPTTRAGYGITDAMPKGPLTWNQLRGDA